MDMKIFAKTIEPLAQQQLDTLCAQEAFKDAKIRIMEDCHAGAGCVAGFTANLGDKVVPNLIGVDIGCQVSVSKIPVDSFEVRVLDKALHTGIPVGFNAHISPVADGNFIKSLLCYDKLRHKEAFANQIGTLGGGNHFIEVDSGPDGSFYLIIHSGSRNLGKQVAQYYQSVAITDVRNRSDNQKNRANEIIARCKRKHTEQDIPELLSLIPNDSRTPGNLCYLEGEHRDDYLHDMRICEQYAALNHETMRNIIFERMGWQSPEEGFTSEHNYIDLKDNIIRKGATPARYGQNLIIPLNMRDGCIFGVGKGNDDRNQSAPHGAGRLMSRTQAFNSLNLPQFQSDMTGIYSSCVDKERLDESPRAYKDENEIINGIADTVDIKFISKPVYNFKG